MGGTPEGVPYVLQVRLKADTTPVLPPEGGSYAGSSA